HRPRRSTGRVIARLHHTDRPRARRRTCDSFRRTPARSRPSQLDRSLRTNGALDSRARGVRILIYAPAARMGGARAHVLGLVPELAAIAPADDVLLIAQPDLLAELAPLPGSWSLRAERAQPQAGLKVQLKQLAWEQRVLPRI